MEDCFEVWLDKDLSPRAHERVASSLWPIYLEGKQILLRAFDPNDLVLPEFTSDSDCDLLILFSDNVPEHLMESYLVHIESPADDNKLADGCCARKALQFMRGNGINASKNCREIPPDGETSESTATLIGEYGECIPGVLGCPPRPKPVTGGGVVDPYDPDSH